MPDDEPVVELLTSHQVGALLRVSYRRVDHWVDRGYLKLADPNPGSGHPRRWWPDEVAHARAFAELVHIGFTTQAAAHVVRTLTLDGEHISGRVGLNVWLVGELS